MIYLMYLALYTVDYENLIVAAQLELLEGAQLAGTLVGTGFFAATTIVDVAEFFEVET